MARARIYRKDQQCPRCGSNWLPKYGQSRGKQTPYRVRGRLYRCGQCLYHFTPGAEHPHQPEEVRKLAVDMYTEGSSLEAIGRVLGVKPGTVYSWVKKSPVGLGVDESPGGAAGGTPPAAASPGHIL